MYIIARKQCNIITIYLIIFTLYNYMYHLISAVNPCASYNMYMNSFSAQEFILNINPTSACIVTKRVHSFEEYKYKVAKIKQ